MIASTEIPWYLAVALTGMAIGVCGFLVIAAIAIWKDYW